MSEYKGLLVFIPSRNRSDLAAKAIASVLRQRRSDVRILVSDNSTTSHEVEKLSHHCASLPRDKVEYIRPASPLPMPNHWEWVLQQAQDRYKVNHFLALTDRMLIARHGLAHAIRVAQSHPANIVVFKHDSIQDAECPVYLRRIRWTGAVLHVRCRRLIELASQMVFHAAVPRCLNCIVPRSVFSRIASYYGNVLLSTHPDYCFGFRSLSVLDSIVFLDRSLLINHAIARSNGASAARGIANADSLSFLRDIGDRKLNYAAPAPDFQLVGNSIVHEYCLTQASAPTGKFPEINMVAYLEMLRREIDDVLDPQVKASLYTLWSQEYTRLLPNDTHHPLLLRMSVGRDHSAGSATGKLQDLLIRSGLYQRLGTVSNAFSTVDLALDYANTHSLRRFPLTWHLQVLTDHKTPL